MDDQADALLGKEAAIEREDGKLWDVDTTEVEEFDHSQVFAPVRQLRGSYNLQICYMVTNSSMSDGAWLALAPRGHRRHGVPELW